ncbi:MAG: molybdopterin cofactor-binding domain-containing protein [Bryobacteraceae bacterium]
MKSNEQAPAMTADALAALEQEGFSRRGFLERAGGFLLVSFASSNLPMADAQAPTDQARVVTGNRVDSWLVINADETVTAYAGKCDFGQGFRTVQHQLVAEELALPMDRVKLVLCDTFLCPDQGVSSGSQGHPTQFGPGAFRQALATAREALFDMAAKQFNTSADRLMVQDGVIMMRNDPSQQVSYGKLIAGKQFSLNINASAKPKHPNDWNVLGLSVLRLDIPAKATGQYAYVHHMRVPGMVHGKVVRPPRTGQKVVSVNENSIKGMAGNPKVVVKNDFVGVVADRQYEAQLAADALVVKWSDAEAVPKQAELYDWLRKQPSRDAYTVLTDDVDQKLKEASKVFTATYLHPYQMHGSIGSSCAVADVRGSGAAATATVWSATQGVYPLRDSIATVTGIPANNIRVIYMEGSGCYGINGADTVAYDATILSQAVGKPVRLQYTRADEMAAGENYGPAYTIDLKAGVDNKNQISVWDYESWTPTKGGRPNGAAAGNVISGALAGVPTAVLVPAKGTPPTAFGNNGNVASSYSGGCVAGACRGTGTVTSERILTHSIQSPFFTGPLRSPNRLQNTFANESFIDEIAAGLKIDPVQYRLRHLSDPRLIDVLNTAARAAGWDTRPSPKPGNARTGIVTGRGIACVLYEGNNGYCGLVIEVKVNQADGTYVVTRMAASQDSGPISNPDGMRNQMEGGALQGLARAMREEVRWDDFGAIRSTNWRTYPVFQFGEFVPEIITEPIHRPDAESMGSGECTITVAAAALANAIFDATGARIRQVPITPDRVLAALKART